MRKSRARAYAYKKQSDSRRRATQMRLSSYRGVIIAACVLLAVLIAAVIIGNVLGEKAKSSEIDGANETTAPVASADGIVHEFNSAKIPVNSVFLDISALDDASLSSLVLPGSEITVALRGEDGRVNYASEAAAKAASGIGVGTGIIANPSLSPRSLFDALISRGAYVTVFVKMLSQTITDGAERDAAMAFERALILEAVSLGANEILLGGFEFSDPSSEASEKNFGYIGEIKRAAGNTAVGTAVRADDFDGEYKTLLFYNLTAVCDFAAADFSSEPTGSGTNITAFLSDNGYYFLRYKLRVIPDNKNRDLREEQYAAVFTVSGGGERTIGWQETGRISGAAG